jgi:phospholipid/cholesterol/gamma-HCH transport system permease protein
MAETTLATVGTTVGGFYAMVLDTVRWAISSRFQRREFVEQAWAIASVCIVPTIMMALPLCVIAIFQINQLLAELGASDLSGAGAGLAVVREIGPLVSVLVVAGAGATAICADLGARKIREETDAMQVMGLHLIPRLVVPRVAAATFVALLLNSVVTLTGLLGSFVFSVYVQHASPGLFVSNLTLLAGAKDFLVSELKATVFGLLAGLVACYLGLNVKGGPKGVGDAVNLTVVYSFVLLFAANSLITAIFLPSTTR